MTEENDKQLNDILEKQISFFKTQQLEFFNTFLEEKLNYVRMEAAMKQSELIYQTNIDSLSAVQDSMNSLEDLFAQSLTELQSTNLDSELKEKMQMRLQEVLKKSLETIYSHYEHHMDLLNSKISKF